MIFIPSSRLVTWATALAAASAAVIVFPDLWLVLLAVDAALLLVALFDALLTPGPGALEVRRLAPPQMSVLHDTTITLLIRNRSRANLSVRLRDTLPQPFQCSTEEWRVAVPADGEARHDYQVRPATRGLFRWGAIHLRYRSFLGLWERQKAVQADAETRVYPTPADLRRYHLLARANRLEAARVRRLRPRGNAWEFESLRDYTHGDDTRLIDWKVTARRRKLIVRNQQSERNQTVLLLVDSGRLMTAEEGGVAKLDHAVNAALTLAHVALARGDRVGLCTFSHRVHSWLAPRPHVAQMRLVMDALYDLRGDFTETDHGRCLRLLSARHRKRALLIVLTDFVDAATAQDMVAHVARAARHHLVLFVALKDSFLERATRSAPQTTVDGFRKSAATDLLRERRTVLETLRQFGAHVIDAPPSDVTPPLINRYLEIAFRGEI